MSYNERSGSEYGDRTQEFMKFLGLKKKQRENIDQVRVIDAALSDMCRMDVVSSFTGLRVLSLIVEGITDIEGLDNLVELEELYLTGNMISSLRGLERCENLRRLCVGQNKIKKFERLNNCKALEHVSAYENRIETLDGLNGLVNLKTLEVQGNMIECVGASLDELTQLEEINISANKISNFKELLNLNRLPRLKNAVFSDPHFGENPICTLCNYQTYLLYHMPQLEKLDTLAVSEDAKAFAEAFMKKRMYYNMRIKTMQRNASNLVRMLKIAKKVKVFINEFHITRFTKMLYEVKREMEERQLLPKRNQEGSQELSPEEKEIEELVRYSPND